MALTSNLEISEITLRLRDWLSVRMPEAQDIVVSDLEIPTASGLSAESVMFSASFTKDAALMKNRYVARIKPVGPALFMDYDLEMEFKVLEALADTSVPAPQPFFLENNPDVLGAPFFVMEWVNGRVAPDDPPFTLDGWVLELSDQQRADMSENALSALVLLHSQNLEIIGLTGVGHGDQSQAGLARLLAYWHKFAAWALTEPNPVIEAGLAWLDKNTPSDLGANVLSWGDARIGNMLVADDMSIAAIIDWEMVATGPRELDLGWWLFLLEHHSRGVGAQLPNGFRSREDEIARYEELSGHTVKNLKYFEILAGVRMGILVASAASLLKKAGHLPADSLMAVVNPATTLLAELLGVPAPTGDTDYYIGNR